jgi:hypothetical protein
VTSSFTAFLVKWLAVSGIAIRFPKSRQSELIQWVAQESAALPIGLVIRASSIILF